MSHFPKPYAPGQIWKVALDYTKGDYWFYYISEMVTRHHVDNRYVLSFKVYKLPFNSTSGYLYRQEDIFNMDASVLDKKLSVATYIRTVRPGLTYEDFVDLLLKSKQRIVYIAGISAVILGLTLILFKVLI